MGGIDGSLVDGECWCIRLKRRAIDDMQLRAGGNFSISRMGVAYCLFINFFPIGLFLRSSDKTHQKQAATFYKWGVKNMRQN